MTQKKFIGEKTEDQRENEKATLVKKGNNKQQGQQHYLNPYEKKDKKEKKGNMIALIDVMYVMSNDPSFFF